jgi:hypothetical protein
MGRESRASQAAANQIGPIFIGVPFTKVDVEKRTVTGIVTDELLDRQGDVVDYETAKAFFTDDKLWPGNIREQHDPKKPVGSKVGAVPNDTDKCVELTAYVSEACPDTWTKCQDGTLKGFSIGGSGRRVVEKQGDKTINRLFLQSLAEVSLVDNPANPRAMFTVAKSVDGAVQLVEPTEGTVVEDATEKASAVLDDAIAKAKDDKKDDKNKTASGEEGKWYAGTDGKSFPISTAKDVANAARGLGRTSQDKAKVKANIIRIAYAHGLESGLPDAWKKKSDQKDSAKAFGYVELELADNSADGPIVKVFRNDTRVVEKGGPEPYDIDAALSAISFVNRLMSSEYWEARYAAAGASDGQKAQIAMLKAACDALLAFLQAEYEEQFEPDAGPSITPPLDLSDVLDDDDVVEMFAKSIAVIKAGARHSKADVEMVQKVHDLSNQLGADCYTDAEKAVAALIAKGYDVKKVETPVVETPAAATTITVDLSAPSADVQKIAADLEATKVALTESQATVAKQAETAAAFEARLKTLEDSPAAGGPVRNAGAVVDKALGGPSETDQASPESVVKALQEIAANGDDTTRGVMAIEIFKLQSKTGANRIAFSSR